MSGQGRDEGELGLGAPWPILEVILKKCNWCLPTFANMRGWEVREGRGRCYSISTILIQLVHPQEQCVCYWPTEKVRQHGDMFIEQSNCSQLPSYTMREFAVTNTKINESRTIKHFQYSDWPEGQSPPNAADVIDLIGVVQKTQHSSGRGPIIVHDK